MSTATMEPTESTSTTLKIPSRSLWRMQPTVTTTVHETSAAEIQSRVRDAISEVDFANHVAMAGGVADFKVAPEDRRFWSPHLSVHIYDFDQSDGTGGCTIIGRFSPRPEIWTMFIAIYGVMAILACGAAIFGYVQWFLGDTPWALLMIPVSMFVIAALHIASLTGQNLSSDQMQVLGNRLAKVLAKAGVTFD